MSKPRVFFRYWRRSSTRSLESRSRSSVMPVCARVINALRPPADEAIATISKVDASGESRLATCPLTISGYVRLRSLRRGNAKVARARLGVSAYVRQVEHLVKHTFPQWSQRDRVETPRESLSVRLRRGVTEC